MGKIDKDGYDRKREWAAKKMAAQREIETLTEEQHEALAEVCRIRHTFHCEMYDYFDGEAPTEGWEIFEKINDLLSDAGLKTIDFTDYDMLPCVNDYYYVISDEERDGWEAKADKFNSKRQGGLMHNGLSLWKEESGEYDTFCDGIEELHNQIENYLYAIDREHGTSYAPSGATRIF